MHQNVMVLIFLCCMLRLMTLVREVFVAYRFPQSNRENFTINVSLNGVSLLCYIHTT